MVKETDPALASWRKHEEATQGEKSAKEKLADARRKHDPRKSTEERLEAIKTAYEQDTDPKRRCLHGNMIAVSFLTICALLLMLIGQIVCFHFEKVGPIDTAARSYLMVLCILGVFVELEWTKLANSKILKWWITRGMFYAFIGVLGMQQNENRTLSNVIWTGDHNTGALKFVNIVPMIMIGVGGLYFLMGALCIQFFYSRQRDDYVKRLEDADTIKSATSRYNLKPEIV